MISWEDYRLILSIARAGGLAGAADAMGVTLSTVFRRLERVEKDLEVRLFERLRGQYLPTDAGNEIILAAENMEQEALAGDRAVTGRDQQLNGTVRITSTESIATSFLARHIPAFHEKYPGLLVDIIADNRVLSLPDREADIALRPRRPKEETLIGRQIGRLRWGIFIASAFKERYPENTLLSDLAGEKLIAWQGSVAATETMNWLTHAINTPEIIYQSSSLLTNAALAAAGDALVPLPCSVGGKWQGLSPVISPIEEAQGELWVVTHQDLRRNARIRALTDHLIEAARQDALFLGGRSD